MVVGKSLCVEVIALCALRVCRIVFSAVAQMRVCIVSFVLCHGGVGQFDLFLLMSSFFPVAYTCVVLMALMCVLMTMSCAVVAAIATADKSDYVLIMGDAMAMMYTHTHTQQRHAIHMLHETRMLLLFAFDNRHTSAHTRREELCLWRAL